VAKLLPLTRKGPGGALTKILTNLICCRVNLPLFNVKVAQCNIQAIRKKFASKVSVRLMYQVHKRITQVVRVAQQVRRRIRMLRVAG